MRAVPSYPSLGYARPRSHPSTTPHRESHAPHPHDQVLDVLAPPLVRPERDERRTLAE